MKRTSACFSIAKNTRSKRPCLISQLEPVIKCKKTWVAATHIRNFMIKDPLVDWLKLSTRCGTRLSPAYKEAVGFTEFLMNKGLEFESELVKHINEHRVNVVSVSDRLDDDSCQKTIDLMMNGAPVIHSAPVKDSKENIGGIIDFLVRSDYLSRLVDECPLTEEEQIIPAKKLNGNYHYIVIDVKYSTLPLRADGRLLLNSGNYPAYKAQTWIYNQCVSQIQGYTPQYTFIMGRRWRYSSKNINYHNFSCLNKLGVIDFKGVDSSFVSKTKEALKWVRDVKQNGRKWSINPPSRPELYPNMCVDSGIWNIEKQKIAERIGEITSVWYCGIKNRETAITRGISSWKHPECTSSNIGIGGNRANIIDKIMAINRQDTDKIWPKKIKNNMYNWKDSGNEMFVDFETLTDVFSDFKNLPEQKTTDMIFMIGVGWSENGIWNYRNFTCNEATLQEEFRIMDEFSSFVEDRGFPKLFYWCAENTFWTHAENRQFDLADEEENNERKDHISDNWKPNDWSDLCILFKSEPIVIKGCFKFGLKTIASAMREHKMISSRIESNCSSGMSAMVNAWKFYRKQAGPTIMKDIEKYNEFDCRVLWEILEYLRKHHS